MAFLAPRPSPPARHRRHLLPKWQFHSDRRHLTSLGRHLPELVGPIAMVNTTRFTTPNPIFTLQITKTSIKTNPRRDWYRSAQATRSGFDDTDDSDASASAARKELQSHELAALAACFVFPVIGTWLLHAIRGNLSRPSEGLVSNYNLTIFLLASEVRPVAHLLRLIQKRTLYLQRVVASSPSSDPSTLADMAKRLEELEAHVAEAASAKAKDPVDVGSAQAAEVRKSIQPDIEALNRAVRRYEKRSTLFALQTEQRFGRVEARAGDALALAAAAQRNEEGRSGFARVLLEWVCACVIVPVQFGVSVLGLPGRVVSGSLDAVKGMLGWKVRPKSRAKGKMEAGSAARRGPSVQRRPVKSTSA